jgi:hypothetical protein
MFNKDFYPTPEPVAQLMGIDCYGKTVLEPQAGRGDLLDYLAAQGAGKLLCCELDERLALIASSKADLICMDFLAVVPEQVSHVDMIVMNPPFSCAAEHIAHAWQVAPEGCEITSLFNHDSIGDFPRGKYKQVASLIETYGYRENLGAVFTTADRTTGVEVGLLKLWKPVVSDHSKFEGFYMDADDDPGEYGLMPANEVERIVGQYKGAIEKVGAVFEAGAALEPYTSFFNTGGVNVNMTRKDGKDTRVIDKMEFAIRLQKKAWEHVFNALDMKQYVTSQVMEDINKFTERQNNIPFTVRNVYKMMEILLGTQEAIFNKSLLTAIDNFTQYTHENRYGLKGWKTNSGHLLAPKFIVEGVVSKEHGYFSLQWGYRQDKIEDLVKVICRLTGTSYKHHRTLHDFFHWQDTKGVEPYNTGVIYTKGDQVKDRYQNQIYTCIVDRHEGNANSWTRLNRETDFEKLEIKRARWYDWGFFQFKVYNVGTMHLKFKDPKVWEAVNRKYAEIKGQVLPEKI